MARKSTKLNSNSSRSSAGSALPHSFTLKTSPSISSTDLIGLTSNETNRFVNNLYYTNILREKVGKAPIEPGLDYRSIIEENRILREADERSIVLGKMSPGMARTRDRARQMRVYEWMIYQGKAGGGTLDVMELAKSLNAVAQERGLIPADAEFILGRDKSFLKSTLLGKEKSKTDKALVHSLIQNIEEIKSGKIPDSLQPWLEAWKDPTELKIQHEASQIKHIQRQLAFKGRAEIFSGKEMITNYGEYRTAMMKASKYDPSFKTQGFRTASYRLSKKEILLAAEAKAGIKYSRIDDVARGVRDLKIPKGLGMYAAVAGTVATAGYILGRTVGISGNDDDYNTMEGLRHGWFGESRKYLTDFGSGYKGPTSSQEYVEATPTNWMGLGATTFGLSALKTSWSRPAGMFGLNFDIDKLSYMGEFPGPASEFLGRKKATVGDLVYNAVRRSELAMAGMPKAFSVSTLMSPSILKDASFKVPLEKMPFDPMRGRTKRTKFAQDVGFGYKDYLLKLTGKSRKEFAQYTDVLFEKGKLYGITGKGSKDLLLKEARLLQRVHAPGITKSVSQLAKSYESIFGIAGVGAEHQFLIGGGATKTQASSRVLHAYAHETVSKYLRLMDDPIKAFRETFPNINPGLTKGLERFTRLVPKLGVGGERRLIGSVPQLLGRHGMRIMPLLVGIPAVLGTLDWLTRQVSPAGTVAGEAGLLGLGAEGIRLAHMTYASISEATGLTALRKSVEEKAPGMTGIAPFIGLTLTGAIAGTAIGMLGGLAEEVAAPAGKARYEAMLRAKTLERSLPSKIAKLPGMKGAYSKAVRGGKYGALIAGALALPFFLTGLGSNKSTEELNEEYIEGKEVAIRKARWWEFGTTPWEGERTMYYRPDWYNRLMARSEAKSIYQGEDISPIGKFVKTLADPYWLEKMHYEDRPYPITGSSGEDFGMFGPLYEWTLGRVLKPPAYMHTEEWAGGYASGRKGGESLGLLGGLAQEEPITPYSLDEQIKQQYYTAYEAMGLRGFASSAVKQAITGEQDIGEHTPILQSAADIDSTRRKYWDLNLGGLLGMTEPYRRITPKRPYTTEYVNPIKNVMPDWMPGEDYYIDFKSGDPFTKIPEGEYRLPGIGYAARYKELEGISPEKYPLIHKYKILADIAPYSAELKTIRKKLEEYEFTDYEQDIYDVTEKQIEEKRKKRRFRDEVFDQSVIGRYGAALADIARASPLEQILPLAPAHKFLPVATPLQAYEESIYGKEFKLWQRPIEDFIKPFATTVGNLIGIDRIPEAAQDTRQIEGYFDQIKYVKFKRLEEQALARGATQKAKEYRKEISTTMAGADLYGNDFIVKASLPKRERLFFEKFKEASPEDRERILELIPEETKEAYIAQWDKELLGQLQEDKLELSEEERYNLEEEIFGRMTAIRAKRKATAESLENSTAIPDEDWIGWRADVDLEDIKLKYLIQTGRDFHHYDLWDDRLRSLRRKPYLEESLEGVDPFAELVPAPSFSDMYRQAAEAGIKNPSITLMKGLRPDMVYDLKYEREDEMKDQLRELGYVI